MAQRPWMAPMPRLSGLWSCRGQETLIPGMHAAGTWRCTWSRGRCWARAGSRWAQSRPSQGRRAWPSPSWARRWAAPVETVPRAAEALANTDQCMHVPSWRACIGLHRALLDKMLVRRTERRMCNALHAGACGHGAHAPAAGRGGCSGGGDGVGGACMRRRSVQRCRRRFRWRVCHVCSGADL